MKPSCSSCAHAFREEWSRDTDALRCGYRARSDKQIWFTQGKVDERLKKACGKYFVPWDERYR